MIKLNEMSTNRLALGTAQFGLDYGVANPSGKVRSKEVEKILLVARQGGIDTLDTAIAYGTSEAILGNLGVDEFRLVTKLPQLPAKINDVDHWVARQVADSSARLGHKKLYGCLLHHPQDLLSSSGAQLIRALVKLRNDGVVQKIGVSIYSPGDLVEVGDIIFELDLVQAPLNVVDRRLHTSGWLDRLKEGGVEVHTRSAFLQGLLLISRHNMPLKFSRWSHLWDQWHEKLKVFDISPLVACLAYPLSLEQVDRVIIGVDSHNQLLEVFQAVELAKDISDTSFMASMDPNLINPSNWSLL